MGTDQNSLAKNHAMLYRSSDLVRPHMLTKCRHKLPWSATIRDWSRMSPRNPWFLGARHTPSRCIWALLDHSPMLAYTITIALALTKHLEKMQTGTRVKRVNRVNINKAMNPLTFTDYDYEWPIHTHLIPHPNQLCQTQILCLGERPGSVLQTGVAEGE